MVSETKMSFFLGKEMETERERGKEENGKEGRRRRGGKKGEEEKINLQLEEKGTRQ